MKSPCYQETQWEAAYNDTQKPAFQKEMKFKVEAEKPVLISTWNQRDSEGTIFF